MYLLDTNVVSELRKVRAGRANAHVADWADNLDASDLYLSVITIQELETGVLLTKRRDPSRGASSVARRFRQGRGNIGARGIDVDRMTIWNHDQIHVFHRYRSEQRFIAHHHCPREAASVLETNFHRAAIGNGDSVPIGQRDFALLEFLEIELYGHVFGQTKMHRAHIDQCERTDRLERPVGWVAKSKFAADDAHHIDQA